MQIWKAVGGKKSLNATLNAGHTTTKALSHSYESYLITVLQRAIRLCLSFSFTDICLSPTLSYSFAQSQTAHSQSALYNLWCCYTTAQCSMQTCSIIPLSGLFQNISDLRQGSHWQWAKKNWEEIMVGMDLFGNWQDWVIDNTTEQ